MIEHVYLVVYLTRMSDGSFNVGDARVVSDGPIVDLEKLRKELYADTQKQLPDILPGLSLLNIVRLK